jgi:hypothetical protein
MLSAFLGIKDNGWFDCLRRNQITDEVNFWIPSAPPRRLIEPGSLWLFVDHMWPGARTRERPYWNPRNGPGLEEAEVLLRVVGLIPHVCYCRRRKSDALLSGPHGLAPCGDTGIRQSRCATRKWLGELTRVLLPAISGRGLSERLSRRVHISEFASPVRQRDAITGGLANQG